MEPPLNYPWVTWLWVIGFSIWGGMLAYFSRVRDGQEAFFLFALFVDLIGAAFAGVVVFLIAQEYSISPLMTAAAVGTAGHLGPRSVIIIARKTIAKKLV